jgi:hypothetical protein
MREVYIPLLTRIEMGRSATYISDIRASNHRLKKGEWRRAELRKRTRKEKEKESKRG